jgi:hypothetical protein
MLPARFLLVFEILNMFWGFLKLALFSGRLSMYLPTYVWEWLDDLASNRARPAPFFCHQHDPPQRGSKVLAPTYY